MGSVCGNLLVLAISNRMTIAAVEARALWECLVAERQRRKTERCCWSSLGLEYREALLRAALDPHLQCCGSRPHRIEAAAAAPSRSGPSRLLFLSLCRLVIFLVTHPASTPAATSRFRNQVILQIYGLCAPMEQLGRRVSKSRVTLLSGSL